MSLHEMVMGKAGGKTGWQHFKDKWAAGQAKDKWQRLAKTACNPLGLKPGDLVDLGLTGDESYEVELWCWYRTGRENPDFARYSLKPMLGDGEIITLEAMPGGESGELILSVLRHDQDVPLDDDSIAMLEADELWYERGGREVQHGKDFEVEAEIIVFGKDWAVSEYPAHCFSFYELANEQRYVSVDALDHPHNVAHVHVGAAIDEAEVNAIGTAEVRT